MDDKKDIQVKEKPRKIGRFTFGIVMVVFGLCILVQMFTKVEIFRYVLMLWPLVFIAFGVETIIYSTQKKYETKFDAGAIILTIVLLFVGTGFSIVNLGINKVLYDNDFKNSAYESLANQSRYYTIDEEQIKIVNLADKTVNVKIQEYPGAEYIKIKLDYDISKDKDNNVFDYIKYLNNISDLAYYDSYNSSIVVNEIPTWIDSINVIVTVDNKDKVLTTGNIQI